MQFGGDANSIKFVYRHHSRPQMVPVGLRHTPPCIRRMVLVHSFRRNSRRHSSLPVGPKSHNRALFCSMSHGANRGWELMIPQPDSPLEVNLRSFFSLSLLPKIIPHFLVKLCRDLWPKRDTRCWLTSKILLIVWPHVRFVLQEVPGIDCRMMKPGLYITFGNNGNNKSLFQNDAYWDVNIYIYNWIQKLSCQKR